MTDTRRQAVEVAMRRRRGASPERAAAVSAHMAGQADLSATCHDCNARLRGTMAEIRAHRCGGQP